MFSKFFKKRSVSTDESKIEELLTRGVERIYPNEEFFKERLKSGERLKIYLGIDPTGPTLHLGHAIPLRKLRQFQDLGHEVVLLMGDFTARIGDPDKKEVRKQLTHKEVLENTKLYKSQAETFLSFEGSNPAKIAFNNDWLGALTFSDVLELASKVTVQQMLERDMFRKRIAEEKPIYLHEFMYPLMQGYDSVAMDVDGEVGGNDQTFNMLTGRTLMKEMQKKEKFVIPMKLLIDPTGAKMGKTTGNMLSFLDSPEDKFGKVMSWTDEMIFNGFELCTDRNLKEIQERISSGENLRDVKLDLAYEIVKTYHGEASAIKGKDAFIATFQKKEIPDEVEIIIIQENTPLVDALIKNETIESKTEFKRLVEAGAITNKTVNEKVVDVNEVVKNAVYRIGKHRFIRIQIQ